MSTPAISELGMSAAGLAVRAVVAVACWAASHRLGRGATSPWLRRFLFALRAGVGSVAAWLVFLALGPVLSYAGGWPLWVAGVAAGVSVESIIALYAVERTAVSRRHGIMLVGLRVLLALLAVLLLLQPVYEKARTRTTARHVAVLLDVSASMRIADNQRSGSEVLRLARVAGEDAAVSLPAPLDGDRPRLLKLCDRLADEAAKLDGFRNLDSASVISRMSGRRQPLTALMEATAGAARDQLARLDAAAPPDAGRVRLVLTNDLLPRVEAGLALLRNPDDEAMAAGCRQLADDARRMEQAMREASAALTEATARQENAYYAALAPEMRARLAGRVPAGRQEWIRRTLLAPLDGGECLLDRIARSHTVRLYEFAGSAEPVDPDGWRVRPAADPLPGDEAAQLPGTLQKTDYASALQRVLRDIPADSLSSVVLLTDGRMDARGNPQPALAELTDRAVAVSSVLIGSREAPRDAGVVRVQAPTQLFEGDKLLARADLKFDGLDGRQAAVRLEHNGQTVDQKTVTVSGAVFRASVELTHAASEKGVARYAVVLEAFEGEFQTRNNRHDLLVAVGDDRIKLLAADDRPRWEFRYLKNLFGVRNKAVRLQHVLFHPSRIEGQAEAPAVRASADRPADQTECTALPADANAWLPFDVVILGDVSPRDLGEDNARAIRRFVAERGGTLIVIAGDRNMPAAYRSGPLADLLPLVFPAEGRGAMTRPQAFRLALTSAGREHPVTRLVDSPAENLRIWEELPLIRWRYPVADTRPGAVVLAYAAPPGGEEAVAGQKTANDRDKVREMKDQLEMEKTQALIALQEFGAGRVLMLCFDSTWRLRFREGDAYHHRFWGQVLRWACTDKLASGTMHVRLGTDRVQYSPVDRVMIRAQVTRDDFSPVAATGVAARVYVNDKLLTRKTLDFVPGSAGHYRAEIGPFTAGTLGRIELDTPPIAAMLGTNSVPDVQTGFVVSSDESGELVDMGADPARLVEMARLTSGTVVAPPDRAAVLERLGPPTQRLTERRTYSFWNSWVCLCIILGVVTAEWLLRKKLGLI